MYAISDDSDRRLGDSSGDRKLPVLFHLIDVSRPRPPVVAEPQPSASVPPAAKTNLEPAAEAAAERPLASITSPPALEVPAVSAQPNPIESPVTPSLPTEPLPAPTMQATNDALKADVSAIEPIPTPQPEQPPAPSPPTPRSQANVRRRAKTSASEDWFASHGKYIAIAFVLALVGTIYFARTNRQQATSTKSAMKSEPVAQNERSGAPVREHAEPRSLNLVNSAPTTAESKVDLHPPTAPDAAVASDKPQAKDELFTFKPAKAADDRVATRSESSSDAGKQPESAPQINAAPPLANTVPPQTSSAPPLANYAPPLAGAATPSSAAPHAPSTPVLAPAYPITSAPSPVYPIAPTPTNAYPQTAAPSLAPAAPPLAPSARPQINYPVAPQAPTGPSFNYRSQYQPAAPPAQPQQPWAGPPPGISPSGQYQPLDNTALGPRYERTGTSNY
jgi:hypothetical protein